MKTLPLKNHFPLIALCLGFFMVIMDLTVVNVALPNMLKNLSGNVSWLQWVVDGYTLTFACLLLSSGNLADRVGAKSTYLLGLILFTTTSLACGLSCNFLMLTMVRLLQGVAAALLVPTSLALINASYKNTKKLALALGIWSAIGGIAAAVGPIIGGLLVFYLGWRAVFLVNIPIGLIAFLLTKKFVINPCPSAKEHFDLLGQLFGIISIAAISFALIETGRLGFSSGLVILSFFIFVLTFIIFLIVELKSTSPMFPLHFFRSQTFSASIAVGWILSFSAFGFLFVLTLYFQHIRNYSALATGFAFLPFLGTNSIGSYLGGKMTSAVGPRSPMVIGLFIGSMGYFTLLTINAHSAYHSIILPLATMGFGLAFAAPGTTVAIINSTREEKAGIVSGALYTSRQIGSLMGVAIFGTIIARSTYFMNGMHWTLVLGGLFYLAGCFIVLLFIKKA